MRALPAARQPAPCPPPGAQRSVARSQARRAGGRGEASAGASCRSAEEPRARVIVPILTNKKNHQGWPQVVSQDIVRHVHNLKSTIFTVVGQVDGKTLLPLPAGSEGIEDIDLENEKSMERIDKSLVYAMESAIIDWSHQIQEALKKESSEPLLQGSNPNPKVELEFWKNRCDDLECIYNQLTTRKVRNMMELLERVESSYIPAFKTMLMDVEAALTEAQDVHLRLTPLKRRLEDVERVEFSEVKPFLLPLLHVVCLIWVTSKHYNMPVRIVVLLQEICNLLIEQALVYLSPEDLLKGDMEESLGKV
ncbi:dynein axonemal heavy chain 9-like [Patagioenas fasciata]|uniref:dynein axonemal heavy chain 9-like n=1 Tax=Patagioenas fasciata TaxID=372321 RepID=UPI003A9951A0